MSALLWAIAAVLAIVMGFRWPVLWLPAAFCIGLAWYHAVRVRRLARRRYIEQYRFPSELRDKVAAEYPSLTLAELGEVERALRQFFLVALDAGQRRVAMPSQAVDAMWHEFILSTRRYRDFCQRAFGRFLHHTPASDMGGARRQRAAMRATWNRCCALEGMPFANPPRLPLLFGLDAALAIPGGFHYTLHCNRNVSATGASDAPFCGSDLGGSGCGGGSDSGSADWGDSDSGGGDGDGGGDSGCSGSGCSGGCGGGGGD